MAKIEFDYDAETRTFYFFGGDKSHRIVNFCMDEDVTLLVDFVEDKAVGFLITNFDVLYPKHVTALCAKRLRNGAKRCRYCRCQAERSYTSLDQK